MPDKRGISGRALAREDNFNGCVPVVFRKALAVGGGSDASGTTTIFDANAPFKFKVIEFYVRLTETPNASNTVRLNDGTNNITDSIECGTNGSGADQYQFMASTYDDAYATISKGGSLKVARTATTDIASADVYVLALRV
jgi:hypothetical protein